MDFPGSLAVQASGMGLTTASSGSCVNEINNSGGGFWNSTGNLGTKVATYLPVIVPVQMTAFQIGWFNGATVSGNVDCGIYDALGNRLVNTGSTVQTTISVAQVVNITDTVLNPGTYFLAISQDNTTGLLARSGFFGAQCYRVGGARQETTALFGLPATWTPVAFAVGFVPFVAVGVESAVF